MQGHRGAAAPRPPKALVVLRRVRCCAPDGEWWAWREQAARVKTSNFEVECPAVPRFFHKSALLIGQVNRNYTGNICNRPSTPCL